MHDTTATESEQMRTWTASSSSNPDALALLPPSIAALGLDELLEDASHAPEDAHISASRSTSFALNDVSSDSLHSSATGASSKQIGGFSRPQEGFRVVGDAIMGALNLSGADGRSSGASGGSYSYSGGGDASNQNGSGGSSGYNEPSSRGIGGGGGLGRGNGDEEGEERKQEKERNRKANPLVDLIETETAYVAELSMIIRVS